MISPLSDKAASQDTLIDAPALDDFLDYLRNREFAIGVDDYLRVQVLLAKVAGTCDRQRLKTLLAPLLTTSATQQQAFYDAFDAFYPLPNAATAESVVPPELHPETPHQRHARRTVRLLLLAQIIMLALLPLEYIGWVHLHPIPQPTKPAPVTPSPNTKTNPLPPVQQPEGQTNPGEHQVAETPVPPTSDPTPNSPIGKVNKDSTKPPVRTSESGTDGGQTLPTPPAPGPTLPTSKPPTTWKDRLIETVQHPQVLKALRAALVAGPLLLLALYELFLLARRKLTARREWHVNPPYRVPRQIDAPTSPLYRSDIFQNAVRQMRRRQVADFFQLDVPATIGATIAAQGHAQFRYAPATRAPEYLVLIDRAASRDHQAQLFSRLTGELEQEGLFVARYFYEGDPRVCCEETGRKCWSLQELRQQYPEHRLLLMGDGAQLIDPLTGALPAWTTAFEDWQERALLTPTSPTAWTMREVVLAAQFLVLPATPEGLITLIERLELPDTNNAEGQTEGDYRLPSLDPDDPDLLNALTRYLGKEVFAWLCACAVYPELQWNLTLHLGALLSTLPGMPHILVTEQNLLHLTRLPWFREGAMPDALRERLIGALDKDTEHAVRQALIVLMEKTCPPQNSLAADMLQLNLAVQRQKIQPSRANRRELRDLLAVTPRSAIRQDCTLARYLETPTPSPLTLTLPPRLRKWLHPGGFPVLGVRSGARFACTCLLITGLWWQRNRLVPNPISDGKQSAAAGETSLQIATLAMNGADGIGARAAIAVKDILPATSAKPTMAQLRDQVIKVASGEVDSKKQMLGSKKRPKVYKYLSSVNLKPGAPWSEAFLYWCFKQSAESLSVTNPLQGIGPNGTPPQDSSQLETWAKQKKILDNTPKVGDILIYHNPSTNNPWACGIVSSVNSDNSRVTVIAGNTSTDGTQGDSVTMQDRKMESRFAFIHWHQPPGNRGGLASSEKRKNTTSNRKGKNTVAGRKGKSIAAGRKGKVTHSEGKGTKAVPATEYPFIPAAANTFKSANRTQIRLIVLHTSDTAQVTGAARSVANYFHSGSAGSPTSAHYIVDDAEVIQCVKDIDIAFGAPGANNDGLQISLAGSEGQTTAEWQDAYNTAMLRRAAKLVAEKVNLYNCSPVWLSAADVAAGKNGITGHYEITHAYPNLHGTHEDPGPNFPKDQFLQLVKEAAGVKGTDGDSGTQAGSGTVAVKGNRYVEALLAIAIKEIGAKARPGPDINKYLDATNLGLAPSDPYSAAFISWCFLTAARNGQIPSFFQSAAAFKQMEAWAKQKHLLTDKPHRGDILLRIFNVSSASYGGGIIESVDNTGLTVIEANTSQNGTLPTTGVWRHKRRFATPSVKMEYIHWQDGPFTPDAGKGTSPGTTAGTTQGATTQAQNGTSSGTGAAAAPRRELYVLCVGVEASVERKAVGQPYAIRYGAAKDDATLVENLLEGSTTLYSNVHATLLVDAEATRSKILDKLQQIGETARPEDTLLFLFTGGSGQKTEAKKPYAQQPLPKSSVWLTVAPEGTPIGSQQVPQANDADVMGKLEGSALMSALANIKGSKYLFLDASHTDSLVANSVSSVPQKDLEPYFLLSERDRVVKGIANHPESHFSLFVETLLKGLSGAADSDKNGALTWEELSSYMLKKAPSSLTLTRVPGKASAGPPFLPVYKSLTVGE